MHSDNKTSSCKPDNLTKSSLSSIPYIFIIIVGLVCWPIGLTLFLIRLNDDRKAALLAPNLLSILGWFLGGFGLFGLIAFATISEYDFLTNENIIGVSFIIAGGATLILTGNMLKNRAKRYKRYIAIVWNDGISDIHKVSSIVRLPYDRVIKDLQRMINKGFLPNGYINADSGRIFLSEMERESNRPDYDIVSCKNCGAHKKVEVGTIVQCDFCGSRLKAM
jgi:uncharacterized membrane protein YqjE